MPGILGIVSDKNEDTLLKMMKKSMNHLSYSVDEYVDNGIYLSRVYLNYFNQKKQPLISKDGSLIIVFHGEIYSYSNENKPDDIDHSSYFLSLYEKSGLEILNKINGHYCACIHDFKNKTTYLISDRYGTLPIYYSLRTGRLIFASEVKAILKDNNTKEINFDAIAELFSSCHLIGNKTLFTGISQIKPASYIKYTDNSLTEIKYWDFPYNEKIYFSNRINSKESRNLQDELISIMVDASKRMSGNADDILLSLSGGLDSRYVAALYNLNGVKNLTAFTMGPDESEDQMYAKKVAEMLNISHFPFDISPEKIWKDAELFSYISDCMSYIHGPLQNFEPLQHFYEKKKIVAYSQMCDALFGGTLSRKKVKILRRIPKLNHQSEEILLNLFNMFDQEMIKSVFKKEVYDKIKDRYKNVPATYLKKEFHPLHIYYLIFMNEYVRRGTLGGNLVTNLYYHTRMISYDNEVFNFGWNLPIEYREYQYLYRMAFTKLFPELAEIKREGYNLKIGASKFQYKIRILQNKFTLIAKNSFLSELTKFYNPWNRPKYVDYNNWFKYELKKNVYDFFNNEKLYSADIIELENVRKIIQIHINGKTDFSSLIWQLINLEYFYRNFMDS